MAFGTTAAQTIADGSITINKLDQDFLNQLYTDIADSKFRIIELDGETAPLNLTDRQRDMFETEEKIDTATSEADYDAANDKYSTSYNGALSVGSIDVSSPGGASVTSFTVGGDSAISGTVVAQDPSYLIQGDTSSGSTFTDQSSNGLTSSTTGDPTVSSTTAPSFATDSIRMTSDTIEPDNSGGELAIGTNWTFQCFFRLDSVAAGDYNSCLLEYYVDSDNKFIVMGHHSGNNGVAAIFKLGGTTYNINKGSAAGEAADTWYHLALVKEGNTMALFFDGDRLNTADCTSWNLSQFDTVDPTIGSAVVTVADPLNGYIDQVMISDAAEYSTSSSTYTVPTAAFLGGNIITNLTDAINAGPLAGSWDATNDGTTLTLTADSVGASLNGKAIAGAGTGVTFSNAVDTAGGADTSSNGLLQTNAITAASAPSTIRVVFAHEFGTTGTINTDLVTSVSRDGGTTWTAVTMALQGTYSGTKNLYAGAADVSAQPSGTSIKVKMQGANAKESVLHGLSVQWD